MQILRYFLAVVIVIFEAFPVISAQKSTSSLNILKCPYGDSDCLVKMYDSIIKELSDGNEEFDIPRLDPIEIKEIELKTRHIGPFNISVFFEKSKFFGFKNSTTKKFVGFPKDFDGKENEIVLFTPKYTLNGLYKVRGTMFTVPIQATGNCTVILLNAYTRLRFISRKIEKNGEIYAQVERMRMTAKFDRMKLEFPNSTSENKLIEDVAREYVNTNWKDAFHTIKESVYVTFGKIWQNIFNQITTKIPYKDFFIEEK